MKRKFRLELTSIGILECLASWDLIGCVSLKFVVFTQTQHTIMGDTQKKPISALL